MTGNNLLLKKKYIRPEHKLKSVKATQTCLDTFHGRVTAPRSHAVISIDLRMALNACVNFVLYLSCIFNKLQGRALYLAQHTSELLCVLHLSS